MKLGLPLAEERFASLDGLKHLWKFSEVDKAMSIFHGNLNGTRQDSMNDSTIDVVIAFQLLVFSVRPIGFPTSPYLACLSSSV